jgi:hypothetical protein
MKLLAPALTLLLLATAEAQDIKITLVTDIDTFVRRARVRSTSQQEMWHDARFCDGVCEQLKKGQQITANNQDGS